MPEAPKSPEYSRRIGTMFGAMHAVASDDGITALRFRNDPPQSDSDHPLLDELEGWLDRYARDPRTQMDLPLTPRGTAFERSVWDALLAIPPGETRSYAGIARTIGNPNASRAVGRANGANPVAILIPCHRVVASDGTLHGYAGGLDAKRALLDHERAGSPLFGDARS
ncbi:MAG: methylated-DNA--[protein]-cysteine S-methyltransferase [Planctomycetota bacterium]